MPGVEQEVTPPNWNDPTKCPFCEDALTNGGAGFINHIDSSEACRQGFNLWRKRISADMTGEWSG